MAQCSGKLERVDRGRTESGGRECTVSSAFFLRSEPANLKGGLAYSCLRHVPERVWTSPLSRRPWAGVFSHDAKCAHRPRPACWRCMHLTAGYRSHSASGCLSGLECRSGTIDGGGSPRAGLARSNGIFCGLRMCSTRRGTGLGWKLGDEPGLSATVAYLRKRRARRASCPNRDAAELQLAGHVGVDGLRRAIPHCHAPCPRRFGRGVSGG